MGVRYLAIAVALGGFAHAASAQPPQATAKAAISLATVKQFLVGTWQETADTRVTRELDANGREFDRLTGEEGDSAPGLWTVFTGSAAPKKFSGVKLNADGFYLEIDREDDAQLFELVQLSRSDLQLVDVSRRILISFTRLN